MSKRIPQSFIDELLNKIDIVSIIERYLPLKKAGSNYSCLCPFHNEKSPSFTISPTKQFYYCFGCGASGNAIGFVMAYEHLSFIETLEMLAAQANMTLPQEGLSESQQSDHQALYDVMAKAAQFYQSQLIKHPEAKKARAYLQQRGLSEGMIKRFDIGFAPSGWDSISQCFVGQQQAAVLLLKTGLLAENDQGKRYDRFRDRIIFPIKDRRGRVIGFGGRVLDNSTPKYLNSPETVVFHKGQELYGLYEARQANRDLRQLIVVEGYMDVIALAEQGIDFAVATLGTAVTSQHVQKLLRTCQQVVFCFDGDLAGQKAAWKALEVSLPLLGDQVEARFMFMPSGEDPDSFVRQQGKEKFLELLKNAASLADFFFDHLSEQVNLETLAGRAQLIALAMPYLQKMTAVVTKELMLQALAKISRTAIEQLRNWSGGNNALPVEAVAKKNKPKLLSRQTPVRFAIALLVQYPHIAKELIDELPDADIPGMTLLKDLLRLLHQYPDLKTGGIFEHWRDQLELKYLMQLASLEILIPEAGVLDEVKSIFKHLQQRAVDEAIEQLIAKANQQSLSMEEKQNLQKLLIYKKTGF